MDLKIFSYGIPVNKIKLNIDYLVIFLEICVENYW